MESKSSVEPAVKIRHGDYISNPFKSAAQGIKALWHNGKSAVWGVVAILFLISIAMIVVVVVALAALLVSFFGLLADNLGGPEIAASFLVGVVPEPLELANSLVYVKGAAISIAIITTVIAVLLGSYAQALSLSLVGQSVIKNEKADFKWIAGNAIKRMWPFIVQGLIISGISLVVFSIPVLFLVLLPGPDTFASVFVGVYYFAAMVSLFYILGRIAPATYSVVIGNLGPWQSLKHSWQITEGKVGEVLGTLAVTLSITLVTTFVLGTANNILVGLGVAMLSIASLFLYAAASIIMFFVATAPLAQRYAELENAYKTKLTKHKIAWGGIVGAIVLAFSVSLLSSLVQAATLPTIPSGDQTSEEVPTDAELEAELRDIYNSINSGENPMSDPGTDLPADYNYDNFYQNYLNEGNDLPANSEL